MADLASSLSAKIVTEGGNKCKASKPGRHRPLAPQLSQGSQHSISATPTAAATNPVINSSAVRHDQCHRSVRARATRTFFFFSRPHLPREHCRVRAARKNEEDGLRASDRAPATGMQDKKLQHGAPTVAGAWDFLPWRSCGTRPYRASFLWDFFPRNSLHQFRCFGGNAPPESVPSEVSPTFHSARVQPCWSLGSCLAPSSTTFRLPRQRVSSSSTIRQIQKWRRASPATLRRISEPPGRRPHRRGMCRHPAVRVVNGGRPASPKRRPGINRRAICFSFSLCCPRIPYPALPSCASNALAVTTTRSVCPFHHSSCGAVLPLYCRRNRHGVRIASSNRSCPVDSEQLCRTT